MTREDILKIVDKCYGHAWFDFKMAESNTPEEHITKTLMKMFEYIGRALREEQL